VDHAGPADDVITIHLGYGRKPVGRVWETIADPDPRLPQGGFNAYDVRFSDQPWSAVGASVSKAASVSHRLDSGALHDGRRDLCAKVRWKNM